MDAAVKEFIGALLFGLGFGVLGLVLVFAWFSARTYLALVIAIVSAVALVDLVSFPFRRRTWRRN